MCSIKNIKYKKEGDLVRYHVDGGKQIRVKGVVLSLLMTVGSLGAIAAVYDMSDHAAAAVTPPDNCFAFSSGTISDYYDNENDDALQAACPKNVDIPSIIGGETVTTIGAAAFYDKGLTAVTLPNTITTIETAGFDSNQLTEVSIPSSMVTIGSSAFSNNQLTEIFVPNSVTSFEYSSFLDNPLESVTIGTADFNGTPELVIPNGAFGSMPTLTHVSLGNNVLEMGFSAFGSSNISSLTLGGSITNLKSGALAHNQITELVIPNSVTTLGMGVADNNPLQSVTIGTADFSGTPELVIPSGSFSNIPTLTSVSLGKNIISIGASVFSNNSISSLTIGDSVTTIDSSTFSANQLTNLNIPSSVTYLGNGVASNNPLQSVTIGTADFAGTPQLAIPSGSFSNIPTLTSVSLGKNVLEVGYSAFSDNNINSFTLADAITTLLDGAIANNQLTSLVIPNSVTTLGMGVAENNPLQSVTIGTADFAGTPQLAIPSAMFSDLSTLTSVSIGNNVLSIGSGSFSGTSITSLTIPSSVTNIDPAAFRWMPLQTVTIHGNPTMTIENVFIESGDGNYIQIFADDADFIAANAPGNIYDAGEPTVWGYVLNPATYSVDYESSTGDTLAPQFVSGVGPTLGNYSIAANPSADFSLYYTAGDSISLQPLAISGYTTPSAYNLILAAGENNYTFTYGAGQLADTGTSLATTAGFAALFILAGSLLGAVALRFRP